MIRVFRDVNVDWLGKRRIFIGLSIVLMLAGMGTALYRHRVHPNGSEAFNLGVDFKGGTVVTVSFKQPPSVEGLRAAIGKAGIKDALIQPVLDKGGWFLVRVPHEGFQESQTGESQAGVDAARAKVREALNTFGAEAEATKSLAEDPKAAYKIEGTEAVGQIADRIRENRKLYRRMSLYDVTNLSINQTLSRTVITSGLVFLSVIALVLLGGETLRPFALALLMGIIFGTYDTIAVAGPIMVWWEKRLEAANKLPSLTPRQKGVNANLAREERARNGVGKPSRAA